MHLLDIILNILLFYTVDKGVNLYSMQEELGRLVKDFLMLFKMALPLYCLF